MTSISRGRPATEPEERQRIIDHVLSEVASGRAVSRIFAEDEGLPAASTFWRWHFEDEILQDNLARARQIGVEKHLDEALDIADDDQYDWTTDSEGNRVLDREHVQRSKLRIETRIKYAQMIAPRKYGPKVDVTSGGEALPPPAPPVVIDARMQSLIAVAASRSHGGDSEPPAIEDLMG